MARKAKLDKKKPFGSIFGRGNRRFEQGGEFFDVEGNHVPDEVVADTGGEVGGNDQLAALAIENEQLKKKLAELEPKKVDTPETPATDKVAGKVQEKKTDAQPVKKVAQDKAAPAAGNAETSELDDQLAAQNLA